MTHPLRKFEVVDRTFVTRRAERRFLSCLDGAEWAGDLQTAMTLRRMAVVHGRGAWTAVRHGRPREALRNVAVAWVAAVGLNGCCRGELG